MLLISIYNQNEQDHDWDYSSDEREGLEIQHVQMKTSPEVLQQRLGF